MDGGAHDLIDAGRARAAEHLRRIALRRDRVARRVDAKLGAVVERAAREGVLVAEWSPTRIRLVTHLDVSTADCRMAPPNSLRSPR